MALKQEAAALAPPQLRGAVYRVDRDHPAEDHLEDGEEFEDAKDEPTGSPTDLQSAFQDCEVAIRKFFNNDLAGAMSLMKLWETTSLYHSLGAAIFQFIPAVLTFDQNQINRTLAALKVTLSICQRLRRNYTFVESLGSMIKKPNYVNYTDIEAHAELCHAEVLLLQAAMTIMEGEDLAGLIKGTIKVKSCYNSYKECAKIIEKKEWQSEQSRVQFQSGVRLGIATFNVMISLLPPKIISLLEFVGFSGNKALGLAELDAGSRAPGMRRVLCDLTLLAYHLVICQFIGAPNDLHACEEILRKQLRVFPESVWFLMFKGRLELMHGKFDTAIMTYQRAINCQNQWQQFRHLCYWEIMWVNSLQVNFREAIFYANLLIDQSTWSKTIYSYSKAALLLELNDEITATEKLQCNDLLRNASYYKQRIAGKSLPMEKFAIKRCARYAAQGGHLVLPGIELLCLWNMFHILAMHPRQAQNILRIIENTRQVIESRSFRWMGPYEADNRALVRFLHGSLLAAINLPRLAIDTLNSVIKLKHDIKEDTFLVPYTLAEMAMCHYYLGERDRALHMLLEARKKYSGYSLESRLHFRLHSKIQIVKHSADATYA